VPDPLAVDAAAVPAPDAVLETDVDVMPLSRLDPVALTVSSGVPNMNGIASPAANIPATTPMIKVYV
jgi:hypothetical protein